eukprot:2545441-Ditylum_brightwellii.AAC.1
MQSTFKVRNQYACTPPAKKCIVNHIFFVLRLLCIWPVALNDTPGDVLDPVEFLPQLVAPRSIESFPPTCYSNLGIAYVKEVNKLILKYNKLRKWTKYKAPTPKHVCFIF